mmetsp:Transcript_40927/g.99197  ORF Transcript_40927/g.99197 Transcript_40927/m.99197 type:complete len:504 (+) Transcript_40927:48-1559(+)
MRRLTATPTILPLLIASSAAVVPYPPDALQLPLLRRSTPTGAPRYLVGVTVGEPGQTLSVLLDTGSHLLLVRDARRGACAPGADVPSDGNCFNSSTSASLVSNISDPTGTLPIFVDVDTEVTLRYTSAADLFSFAGLHAAINATLGNIGLLSNSSDTDTAYFWADADGVLGASHSSLSTNPIELLLQPHGLMFALDLSPRGANGGTLLLGGTYALPTTAEEAASTPLPGVEWSEVQDRPRYQQLELFEPAVCGASLLGKTSSHWSAIVDTGSSCLSLPDDVFDAMWGWVPANCTSDSPPSPGTTTIRRCYLLPSMDATKLPVLSFRLEQHGRTLQLPLEELLLPPDQNGAREFCVRSTHRTAADASCPEACPSSSPILIGTMALQRFFAVFDMQSTRSRVGLAPKYPSLSSEELAVRKESCIQKSKCIGQQHYSAASNRCIQPDCKERYFQHLDEERGECDHVFPFKVLITLLIGGFTIAEVLLQRCQIQFPLEAELTVADAN